MPTLQQKRGTALALETANPTPLAGEIVWVSDTNTLRVGDGTTAYSSLAVISATPTSHSHGNITNAGAIGSTANLPIITTTSGVLTTGSFGTTAATFCQGNDARLSDTRTPTDNTVSTAKLQNDAVTYAKLQNVSATDRVLGRSSAGSGDVEEITCTAFARTILDDTNASAARATLAAAEVNHTHSASDVYVPDNYANFGGADLESVLETIDGALFGGAPTASPAFTGAATVTNDGNVVPITITNTGTANSFVVNDASGDTTPFVIDANGRVVIGGTAASSEGDVVSVINAAAATGNVSRLFVARASAPSSSTSAHNGFQSSIGTDAASFTVSALRHFIATQGTLGAGSSVTDQYGFAALSTITGATNNYGFYSDIASGTGRWNFYSNGTAPSYFGGQLLVTTGSASACGVAFSGDPDTGIAQLSAAGANTLSICTNSAERVRVGSGGGVGIGTATTTDALNVVGITSHYQSANGTPALGSKQYYSACFENFSAGYGLALGGVQGGNGAAYLQVQSFSSAVAYPMYLQALGGEVLIGTTTDQGDFKLQVAGNTYLENLYLSTTVNYGRLAISHAGATTFAAGWNNTDTSSTGQTTLNILRNGTSVGTISTTNTATSYNTTSDYRLKANPRPITNATERIARIKPSQWDWHVGGVGEGFIAHELSEAVPLAVTGEKDAVDATGNPVWQTVDMSKVVPVLVAALQEANARIAALEERLNHA